jgi:N-acetyl-1-D-myo-inositol-2-amino-2-deoxy-alpha-D-glucopyranoside deacetylase
VQAHRVATYAATLAGIASYRADLGAAWDIPKIYWNATSESRMREGLRTLRASGDTTTFDGLPAFVISDEWITTEIDGLEFVQAKMAAMRAHATQIEADGEFFVWSRLAGDQAWAVESYRIVKGTPVPAADGLETDLFAGVA